MEYNMLYDQLMKKKKEYLTTKNPLKAQELMEECCMIEYWIRQSKSEKKESSVN
nr:MAG TPA: Protein of unknown function (DUF1317) [Caudoviricetes sp.]